VGDGGTTVLSNGNYVVSSPEWNGDRGAVTWADGSTGISGVVSADNSLAGITFGDYVGRVYALTNGNYVVISIYRGLRSRDLGGRQQGGQRHPPFRRPQPGRQ
jgi:hypothetical protein